jgi:hypothetical protein
VLEEYTDLSLCKVWWDGINIHGSGVKDAIMKSGTLSRSKKDIYTKGLTSEKDLLRIEKYMGRGFNIDLPFPIENMHYILKKNTNY